MMYPNFNGIIGAPSFPTGMPVVGSPLMASVKPKADVTFPLGNNRAISYAADHQGCGFWRIHWPESIINGQQMGIISNNNFMILQESFYSGIKSVRIQRQVTPAQYQFVKFLRDLSDKTNNFKIYYEIDDVIFAEDIPTYNKAREAFVDPAIAATATKIMQLCDAITTPTKYMSGYYTAKTGVKSITIPNYMPKFWMDRYYSKQKVVDNYEKNKKRPRIGYVGSPTHFNIGNTPGARDDFADILEVITKTIKDFKWVIMGGLPAELANYVREGHIEYRPWARIYDYPQAYNDLNLNVAIAPLQNNPFNLAKANIKYIEAGAFGVPCICQDLEPYKCASMRFNTGAELIDQIKKLTSDRRRYLTESDNTYKFASTFWLEDHIHEFAQLYFA